MHHTVIVIGAGAAGMMCALEAGKRGRRVLILDHAKKLGGKILISGGGRCNFTNTGASPAQYVSENLHFCKSALSRYPSSQFIALVEKHKVAYHEKKLGQLFCDFSAQNIVDLLKRECDAAQVDIQLNCEVFSVSATENLPNRFIVKTSQGIWECESLVIATGGLSLPKIGATDFGYRIARQFGLAITELAPALDGFVLAHEVDKKFCNLSGVSIFCEITCGGMSFIENILFTHTGLSGPAALQASLYWRKGVSVAINLFPKISAQKWLEERKKSNALLKNVLSEKFPARFVELFLEIYFPELMSTPMIRISDQNLQKLAQTLANWTLNPIATVGYSKAEVTRGGVSTDELSSKTLEAKKFPGLYFIGEVVDVTGWLGGYNFQWAWASGWAAGQAV